MKLPVLKLFIMSMLLVFGYGLIREQLDSIGGYDEILKVESIDYYKEQPTLRVRFNNGKYYLGNYKWERYKFKIGDSIKIKYDKDSVLIYRGNVHGIPGNR